MALQTSGAISINDLVAEFGGTAPHSLSEYYRGGALVPDTGTNSGVPTSGAISLTDFYGAAAFTPDVTPNAVDWLTISGNNSNPNQTINGINQTITLRLSTSGTVNSNESFTIRPIVNGSSQTSIFVDNSGGAETTFNVTNGDNVSFLVTGATGFYLTLMSVFNDSDGGVTLDTFNCTNF